MGIWDIARTLPLVNLLESFVDAARDQVQPVRGSILYVDLALGTMEYSGVYLEDCKIAHVESSGHIRIVGPSEFMSSTTALNIYVSSKGLRSVGSEVVAQRAESMVGKKRDYNVLFENCHRFCAGCLNGNFKNRSTLLSLLKVDAQKNLGADTWRTWSITDDQLYSTSYRDDY
jgi:hypothetical protein